MFTDEAFLGQLEGEATSNLFQFVIAVVARVDLDSGLGTAERHIHTGTFECHQRRQGLHFINVDLIRISDTYTIILKYSFHELVKYSP